MVRLFGFWKYNLCNIGIKFKIIFIIECCTDVVEICMFLFVSLKGIEWYWKKEGCLGCYGVIWEEWVYGVFSSL